MDAYVVNALIGTFARVWLARFRGQTSECKSKVFALKILRKVDSE